MRFALHSLAIALVIFLSGCQSDDGTSDPNDPITTSVRVTYDAPTAIDPSVQARFPNCVTAVGRTHLHASWRNFAATNMNALGARGWEITFNDAPAGRDLSIRINDPNGCATDVNGAVTTNIFANGVRLIRVVGTPGNGTEPGLAFTVTSSGIVIPN